jgi:thiol-disulfide isomerase/thioredoxin
VSNKPSRQTSASAKVRAASSGGGRSTTWLWVGLVVLVVVIGVAAVAIAGSSSGSADGGGPSPSGGTVVPNGDLEYGSVEVSGTPIPAAAATGADPAVGMEIPTVTGETFDGSPVTISPDGGSQVILGLAHWCPHCQREVPLLQEWLDENGMPSDVQLTAVATSNDPSRTNFPAGDWLRKEKWSVPTLLDDKVSADKVGTAGQALGVSGFPSFTVVGPDGTVVFRTSGEISMDQWEALLESARTGVAPTA